MSRPARSDGRRRHSRRRVALGLVVASIVAVGCTSSTGNGSDDGGGGAGDGPAPTLGDDDAGYAEVMTAICTETDDRIAELPTPPEEISRDDWAGEVARAYLAEYEATDDLLVRGDLRPTHRSYVATTEDLADAWSRLAEQLAADPEAIGDINTEIVELALGRDDLADELGLTACRRSAS